MHYRMGIEEMQLVLDTENGDRFQALGHKAEMEETAGMICYRFDFDIDDAGAPGFKGKHFLISNHERTCISPSGGFIVKLVFGERTPPGVEQLGSGGKSLP